MANGDIIQVRAPNVRAGMAAARRATGTTLKTNPTKLVSGGEDGLYRVTLRDGTVVQITVAPRQPTELVREGE